MNFNQTVQSVYRSEAIDRYEKSLKISIQFVTCIHSLYYIVLFTLCHCFSKMEQTSNILFISPYYDNLSILLSTNIKLKRKPVLKMRQTEIIRRVHLKS